MADSDIHASGLLAFFSQLDIELLYHFPVFLGQLWPHFLTSVFDVSTEKLRSDFLVFREAFLKVLLRNDVFFMVRVVFHM